jgi:hypothetical protein
MARAKRSVARSDRYTYGKKIPSDNKQGFRIDKSQPRDSLTQPRPSQLTQSEFNGTVLSIQESMEDMKVADFEDQESMEAFRQDIEDQIQELNSDLQDKESNLSGESMEHLPVYELITERMEAVDQWEQDVNSIVAPDMDAEEIRVEVEFELDDQREEMDEDEFEMAVSDEMDSRMATIREEFIEELQACTCEI